MPEERNPAGHAGLAQNLSSLASAAIAYVQARAGLVGLEAREAGRHYLRVLLLAAAGAVLLLFAYLLLLVGLAFLAATMFGVDWLWVCLGLGAVHLAAAAAALLLVLHRIKQGVFPATMAELNKDREWISSQKKNND